MFGKLKDTVDLSSNSVSRGQGQIREYLVDKAIFHTKYLNREFLTEESHVYDRTLYLEGIG